MDRINESHIEEVLITNTIPLVPEAREIKKLKQISVGYMLAKCIEAIQDHTPVSSLFELFND